MLFGIAVALAAFGGGVMNAVFNNFLSDTFHMSSIQRTTLELPRELPGFLTVFFSAALFMFCARRQAALANIVAGIGLLLLAFFSSVYSLMLAWLFIFSSGQHLFLPLTPAIGMELAHEGQAGKRLGQLTSTQNLFTIIGSFAVCIGFAYLGFSFRTSFIVAAAGYIAAGVMIWRMRKDTPLAATTKFRMRKEYRLYYLLTIVYGMRKQIFLTFAPWVLVTVFSQKVEAIATLLTIGGVIGIFFTAWLGRAIDRFGEKVILAGEAVVLVFVCIGYGFSKTWFAGPVALAITGACFVADQLLMSVGMARATYLKKIAVDPKDVTQTLTLGTTLDHVFSIGIALVSGAIWAWLGYQYVFMLGAVIATANFFLALRVRVPNQRVQQSVLD